MPEIFSFIVEYPMATAIVVIGAYFFFRPKRLSRREKREQAYLFRRELEDAISDYLSDAIAKYKDDWSKQSTYFFLKAQVEDTHPADEAAVGSLAYLYRFDGQIPVWRQDLERKLEKQRRLREPQAGWLSAQILDIIDRERSRLDMHFDLVVSGLRYGIDNGTISRQP